jgi:glycosyltransferase involved in cell wall biosynthesis
MEDGPLHERLKAANVPVDVLDGGASLRAVSRQGPFLEGLRALPRLFYLARQVADRAAEADVVFANSQKSLVVASLAKLLRPRPLVWSLHDILTAGHFSWSRRTVAATLANWFADTVVANSKATKVAFQQAGGRSDSTCVVYNGIDATPFNRPRPDDRVAVREEFGIGNAPLVGVFSRLAAWKGQDVLIAALPECPDVHALLVGGALFGDDVAYERDFRAQAETLGVAHRVHFAGNRSDVPRLMKGCDVVAHTSTAPEPFGRVIVEGMLAGVPVVATRGGGALEIVRDGETGFLVNPGDACSLAHAIQFILAHPEVARAMTETAHDDVLDRFTVGVMIDRLNRVIQRTARSAA